MASNVVLYTLLFATVNNAVIAEEQSIDLKRIGGGQIIHTVLKRFSGISPGSSFCQISIMSAVPAAAIEFDPGDVIDGYVPVDIGIVGPGGKTAKTRGFIMEDEFKHGVDQQAQHTLSFIGAYPTFE